MKANASGLDAEMINIGLCTCGCGQLSVCLGSTKKIIASFQCDPDEMIFILAELIKRGQSLIAKTSAAPNTKQ